VSGPSLCPVPAILGLALVGYLAGCAHPSQSSGDTNGDSGVLSGTVAYRERMALPVDAVVTVTLVDVSLQDVAAPIIAETAVQPGGRQVPLPFELRFDRGKIDPKRTYALRASIRSGGQLMFTTNAIQRVITQGNPTHVDLRLVRADGVPGHATTAGLSGTTWLLEDLGGAGVLDRVEATLEFPEVGKVAGKGSCNRFFGSVEISGASISFGPLGSTRMACMEAVMNQETKYLGALQGAERFRIDGTTLLVYARGLDRPLRFIRTRRTDSVGESGAESAPTSVSPADTTEPASAGAWRAIGTEPFWGLDIDSTGLRFRTPEDTMGIRWPPLTPMVRGDTVRWIGETERAAVDARIWAARCSDGMSDRVWPYTAVVRIDSTTYRGCAESRA
jgi:putative lipoprotein